MIGIYFSGTGNTKFCVEKFIKQYDNKSRVFSIEDEQVVERIKEHETIVIGYPVQYSNIPKIMYDFVLGNQTVWRGKKVYVLATMAMFSGDGAGVLARLLEKCGAYIIGGLHLKMPDSICDEKVLKRSMEDNRKLVQQAAWKIEAAVAALQMSQPTQDGLKFWHHFIELFGQRLYFYSKTRRYSTKLKIDADKCIGCKKCVALCPMKNISMEDKQAVPGKQCTMCYRCVSKCPVQAITLLGKEVIEQSSIEKYS